MTQHACDHDHSHDTATINVDARLKAAEALCVASGERLTAPRLRTYELILGNNGPMKAYDVIDRFHPDGAAKPPTVYRALSFLEQMGLIHRIESLNAFVACATPANADHHHPHTAAFLLCDCCGQSEEIATLSLADIEHQAQHLGFAVKHITVEAKGLCKACR